MEVQTADTPIDGNQYRERLKELFLSKPADQGFSLFKALLPPEKLAALQRKDPALKNLEQIYQDEYVNKVKNEVEPIEALQAALGKVDEAVKPKPLVLPREAPSFLSAYPTVQVYNKALRQLQGKSEEERGSEYRGPDPYAADGKDKNQMFRLSWMKDGKVCVSDELTSTHPEGSSWEFKLTPDSSDSRLGCVLDINQAGYRLAKTKMKSENGRVIDGWEHQLITGSHQQSRLYLNDWKETIDKKRLIPLSVPYDADPNAKQSIGKYNSALEKISKDAGEEKSIENILITRNELPTWVRANLVTTYKKDMETKTVTVTRRYSDPEKIGDDGKQISLKIEIDRFELNPEQNGIVHTEEKEGVGMSPQTTQHLITSDGKYREQNQFTAFDVEPFAIPAKTMPNEKDFIKKYNDLLHEIQKRARESGKQPDKSGGLELKFHSTEKDELFTTVWYLSKTGLMTLERYKGIPENNNFENRSHFETWERGKSVLIYYLNNPRTGEPKTSLSFPFPRSSRNEEK